MIITILGNLIYIYLQDFSGTKLGEPKVWMLISRFIMGIGACKIYKKKINKYLKYNKNLKQLRLLSDHMLHQQRVLVKELLF